MKVLTGLKALTAVALLGAGAANAADFVVIQSQAAGVTQGEVISDSATMSLQAGETVTLLSASGETIALSGPFEGVPQAQSSGGDGAFATAIANMLQARQKSTASLGAVRSGTVGAAETPVPQPWLISVENSGDRCLYGDRAVLWRADNATEGELSLTGGVKSIRGAAWPAGTDQVALSNDMFVDGASYTATLDGSAVELRVHKASAQMDNPAELAAWMAEKGCTNQALALLNSLQ